MTEPSTAQPVGGNGRRKALGVPKSLRIPADVETEIRKYQEAEMRATFQDALLALVAEGLGAVRARRSLRERLEGAPAAKRGE